MFLTPYTKKNELHNYNPFRAMEEMERAFFGGNGIAEFKTDIRDTGDAYVLEADLPGFKTVSYTHLVWLLCGAEQAEDHLGRVL